MNKPAPVVTVVTVTLDCAGRLAQTLDSIAVQEGVEIESLVIDGGSSDDTLAIARRHPAVTRIVSEPDEGIYDAMNKGLRAAAQDSQWITFLNAGDRWLAPDVIRRMVEAGREHGRRTHLFGDLVCRGRRTRYPRRLGKWFLSLHMVCHQCIFFRTSRHRRFPYDPTFKVAGDYRLLLQMLEAGERFAGVGWPVVDYEAGGVGTSETQRERLHQEKQAIRRAFGGMRTLHLVRRSLRALGLRARRNQ